MLLTLEREVREYIENITGSLILIKYDGDVRKIKNINLRSKEEFELECILFLDTYQNNFYIDYIQYIKDDEVIYSYDNKQENIKNKRR